MTLCAFGATILVGHPAAARGSGVRQAQSIESPDAWVARRVEPAPVISFFRVSDHNGERQLDIPGFALMSYDMEFSPGGKYLAIPYAARQAGQRDDWRDDVRLLLIEGWTAGQQPVGHAFFVPSYEWAISPDDKYLAWQRKGMLHIREIRGRDLYEIGSETDDAQDPGSNGGWDGFLWSPDSRRLLWMHSARLYVVDIRSGAVRPLARATDELNRLSPSGPGGIRYFVPVSWVPSSTVQAYAFTGGSWGTGGIWVRISSESQEVTRLEGPLPDSSDCSVHPDGRFFWVDDRGLMDWHPGDPIAQRRVAINDDFYFDSGNDEAAQSTERAVICGTLHDLAADAVKPGSQGNSPFHLKSIFHWKIILLDGEGRAAVVLRHGSYRYRGPVLDGRYGSPPGPVAKISADGRFVAWYAPKSEVTIIPATSDEDGILTDEVDDWVSGPITIVNCDRALRRAPSNP